MKGFTQTNIKYFVLSLRYTQGFVVQSAISVKGGNTHDD